ncbi:uncharacterized protein LOC129585646 isoform X2 [Paramacrobiotus metropolitanus]|uniref:uncharacterized protein LOC129585646 isoform X2 n=1 Tax=Paramacrobiotus metropolitanus TaxID=2943436 RepID=UPI002445F4F1|nr:uncharacterized protein LOC129585646 isoform X2 [Paramacrobiotus metropolitanus]
MDLSNIPEKRVLSKQTPFIKPCILTYGYYLWMNILGIPLRLRDSELISNQYKKKPKILELIKRFWTVAVFAGAALYLAIDFSQYFVQHYSAKLYAVDFFALIVLLFRWWSVILPLFVILDLWITSKNVKISALVLAIAERVLISQTSLFQGWKFILVVFVLNLSLISFCTAGYMWTFSNTNDTYFGNNYTWFSHVPVVIYGRLRIPQWIFMLASFSGLFYSTMAVLAVEIFIVSLSGAIGGGFKNVQIGLKSLVMSSTSKNAPRNVAVTLRRLNLEHFQWCEMLEQFNYVFSSFIFLLMVRDLMGFLAGVAIAFRFPLQRDSSDVEVVDIEHMLKIIHNLAWGWFGACIISIMLRITTFIWINDQVCGAMVTYLIVIYQVRDQKQDVDDVVDSRNAKEWMEHIIKML